MKNEIIISGVCVLSSAGITVSELCRQSFSNGNISPEIDLRTCENELSLINTGAHELYRIQKLLLVATLKAAKMAGVFSSNVSSEKIGIFMGNSYGLNNFKSKFYRLYKENNPALTSPSLFPFTSANALASWLSIQMQAKGPNLTFADGCVSSSQAILAACDALVSDECEVAFVGGVNLLDHDLQDEQYAAGFRCESAGMLVLEKRCEKNSTKKQTLAYIRNWQNGVLTEKQVQEIALGNSIANVNIDRFNIYKTTSFEVACLGNNLGGKTFVYSKKNNEISFGNRKIFLLSSSVGNMFDAAGIMGVVLSIELLNAPQKVSWRSFSPPGDDILFSNIDTNGSAATMVIRKNKIRENDGLVQ